MKPFANEPILELRRAAVRSQLVDALKAHDARPGLKVPVWIGGDTREGADIVSTDPGNPDHVVAEAAAATPADVDAAVCSTLRLGSGTLQSKSRAPMSRLTCINFTESA